MQGHNLQANILWQKRTEYNQRSKWFVVFSPCCPAAASFASSQVPPSILLCSTKTEKSLPKASGLASSQRCASEMYDITSFADSVLPAPDSPLISTTYQWKMQATCAVPVCLSACVLHVYEYVMYVRTSIHPRAPEMVKARNGLTGSSMLLKALSNFATRKHSWQCKRVFAIFPNLWRNNGGALTACRPNA